MLEACYIIRSNIERYKSLLDDDTIIGEKRRVIRTLLAENEAKLPAAVTEERKHFGR